MTPWLGRMAPVALLVTSGCHPTPQSPPPAELAPPIPTVCAVRIAEPDLPETSLPVAFDVPQSEVVVGISFDAATLTNRLAKEVPPRVASARNVDAGIAGKLTYHIDRSPFSVAVHERRLFVSTHLTSRADMCKPLGPLGCVDYAHCSPEAQATASIPLSLGSTYRLGPANVAIRVTRPCRVGAVDATSRIQLGADQQARRLQQRINALLPSFADDAQVLWNAMGVHVPLDLDTRLRITPHDVVEGTPSKNGSLITIPLGVRGTVRIEPRQGKRDDLGAIPPPRSEPGLAPGLRLIVPIGVDLDAIDADLSRSVRDGAESAYASTILSVRTRPDADGLLLLVSIKGPSCGVIAFRATPAFDQTSGRIVLSEVAPLPQETSRVRALDPTLDLHQMAAILQHRGRIALPVDPFAIPQGLERSVELLASKEGPDVQLDVSEAAVDRVIVTGDGVAAIVNVHGNANVVLR